MPRVRSEDPLIARLIADAPALFRDLSRLVVAIDTTNGIVYVEIWPVRMRRPGVPRLTALTSLGPIASCASSSTRAATARGCIGAIGHELQHAWEMLRVPGLTTIEAMFFHALGTTATAPTRFETDEAIKAGERIEREVRRGRAEH